MQGDKLKVSITVDRELWAKVRYVATMIGVPANRIVEHSIRKLLSLSLDEIRKELEVGSGA